MTDLVSRDAEMLRLLRENAELLDVATRAHVRCTELLDEVRANRRIALAPPGELHALAHLSHERRLQDARFGTPADLLHVPFGPKDTGLDLDFPIDLKFVRELAAIHCTETGRETCCWAHVLMEEAFEVLAEAIDGDAKKMRQELVQLGAVCVRVIEAIALGASR